MAHLRPVRFVLRLLHYLKSLAAGSINGLLALIGWAYRRLARNRDKPFRDYFLAPSDSTDTESPSNPHLSCPSAVPRAEHEILDVQYGAKSSQAPDEPPSHPPPESVLLRSNNAYICPSFAPRAEHVTLDIPLHDHVDDNDGPYTTTIRSPSPAQPSFSGHGSSFSGQGRSFSGHVTSFSGPESSYRAISIEETSGSDTRSVNSRGSRRSGVRQINAAGISAISVLPISTHGLQMVTAGPGTPNSRRSASLMPSRPTSRNSQKSALSRVPIKISSPMPPPRHLTPPPIANSTGDTHSRSSSPESNLAIYPMSTSTVQRWNRGVKVSTEFNHCLVEPYNFEFKDNPPPEGWAACHHPEGALYFFHAEKRVFTDVLMHDPENATMVNEAASRILGQIHLNALDEEAVLPKEYDLVIELVKLEDETVVGYYFADHASRLLFWMDEFDASRICREIICVVSFSHLRLEIESQYWTHYELYPNCRDYTTEVRDEVRGILLHATADTVTSVTSTALWTTEENKTMLHVIEKLQVDYPADRVCAGAIIGRVMRNLKHMQFIQLYGQHGARLDRDQSVHGSIVHPHGWYLKIVEPLLFWGTEVHLVSLEKIWVDRTIDIVGFRHFIGKLNEEWYYFFIVAAVLLNANMAFLSIQSVDDGRLDVPDRSAAQIVSYISIVTSLGSALLSLLLTRQNRSKGRESADTVANFLGNATHNARGLEHLAILYALPYALLMWSTLTFLAAFSLDCFVRASLATRVPVGSALVLCITLVIWCVITAWLCGADRMRKLGDMKSRARERARGIFGMALDTGVGDGDEYDKKQGGEEEKRQTDETAVGTAPTTPNHKRKQSRSRSWLPGIFVRGPTGEDIEAPTFAPPVELEEVPSHDYS